MGFSDGIWGSWAKHETGKTIPSQTVEGVSRHAEELVFYPVQQYCLIVLLFSLPVSLVPPSFTFSWALAQHLFNQIG